jgi:hypothetical protein
MLQASSPPAHGEDGLPAGKTAFLAFSGTLFTSDSTSQTHGIDYAICREEWNAREQRLELTGLLPRMWPLLVGPEGKRLQGKALNQRCGLMFCWGEFVQTMDANQDFTFEDALKVRAHAISVLNAYLLTPSGSEPPDGILPEGRKRKAAEEQSPALPHHRLPREDLHWKPVPGIAHLQL